MLPNCLDQLLGSFWVIWMPKLFETLPLKLELSRTCLTKCCLKPVVPAPAGACIRCHISPARRRIAHFANRISPRWPFRRFEFRFLEFISIYIFYIQKTASEYKYVFLLFCISFIYIGCIISIYLEYNSTSTERLFMFLVCIDGKVILCDKKNACKYGLN